MGGCTRATQDPSADGNVPSLGYVSVNIVVVILTMVDKMPLSWGTG